MARVAGVEIPEKKQIAYALPYIKGIGLPLAKKILEVAQIEENVETRSLSEAQLALLSQIIEKNYKIEGELKAEVRENVKRLIEMGSYRGLRHKRSLPSRGQRTRHNARTRKGRRKTVGGLKRKLEKT